MARPSRSQTNRAKRKKSREFKRGKPTIAKQKKVAIPTDKDLLGPQERVSTTKPSRATITPRRGRRIPKGALPAGPREILIVSRKGQPQVFTQVEPLEKRDYLGTVSSSWLSTIGYIYNKRMGLFTTQKSPKLYRILNFDFETFEEWYYAGSKGTFWNDFIRDQYTIE